MKEKVTTRIKSHIHPNILNHKYYRAIIRQDGQVVEMIEAADKRVVKRIMRWHGWIK